MRVLRLGLTGDDVVGWQRFLTGQDFYTDEVSGSFDEATKSATIAFQAKNGLTPDGVVSNLTFACAMDKYNFELVKDPDDVSLQGPNWPPKPQFSPLVSTAQRQDTFGSFRFQAVPTPSNPEALTILDGWALNNIVQVEIPQLIGIPGAPSSGTILFHKKGADQIKALFRAWEENADIHLVLSWAGSFAPRFIRGSRSVLSNHAFGTAFDINAQWNPLGALPAKVGKPGSVRSLVPLANEFGFYWGGHYANRPDGMHFELAVPDS